MWCIYAAKMVTVSHFSPSYCANTIGHTPSISMSPADSAFGDGGGQKTLVNENAIQLKFIIV